MSNPMDRLQRIVVLVENEVGAIAGITKVLADGGVNLDALSTETRGDQGAVILTTEQVDRALALLNQAGYKAVSDDAIVLRLPDEPGALASVADELKQAGVNIQGLHILGRQAGYATIVLTTDDRDRAEAAIHGGTII